MKQASAPIAQLALALALALAYPHHPALTAAASETDTNGPSDRELLSAEVHGWLADRSGLSSEPGGSGWLVPDGTKQRLSQPAASAVSLAEISQHAQRQQQRPLLQKFLLNRLKS